MSDGRQRDIWVYLCHILVQIANTFRGQGTPAVKAEDIYPFTERREPSLSDFKAEWKRQKAKGA